MPRPGLWVAVLPLVSACAEIEGAPSDGGSRDASSTRQDGSAQSDAFVLPEDDAGTVPGDAVPMFVVIGKVGRILASCDDGATWSERRRDAGYSASACAPPTDCDHHPGSSTGLAYGGGYFFATFGWGENPSRVFRSADGVAWTLAYEASGYSMAGITWAGDRVVVGDYTPRYSLDLGMGFMASAVPDYMVPMGAWPNARQVGYAPVGGGRVMLLSGAGDSAWGDTTVSDDHGLTYHHPTVLPSDCRGASKPPTYGGGTWLEVWAGTGAICRSTDGGDTWSVTHISEATFDLSNAVWNGSEFVLYQGTRGFRSSDGSTFTEFASNQAIAAVAFNPRTGTYIGLRGGWDTAYDKQRVYRSVDGATWQTLDEASFPRSHPITHVTFGYGSAAGCASL